MPALLIVLVLCEAGLAVIGGLAWSAGHEAAFVLMGASGAAGVVVVLLLLWRAAVGHALAVVRLLGVFLAGAVLVAVGELTPAFAAGLALFDALIGVYAASAVRRRR